MPSLEKEISLQVRNSLKLLQMTKTVLWWTRLNTGKIRTEYGKYVQLCPKGTPDYLALVWNKEKSITAIFIETKSDTGKLKPEQIEFYNKYNDEKYVYTLVIRDIEELNKFIESISINLIDQIKFPG